MAILLVGKGEFIPLGLISTFSRTYSRNVFAQCLYPLFARTVQNVSKCQNSFVSRILINSSTCATLPSLPSTREYSTPVRIGWRAGKMFRIIRRLRRLWWCVINAPLPCSVLSSILVSTQLFTLPCRESSEGRGQQCPRSCVYGYRDRP